MADTAPAPAASSTPAPAAQEPASVPAPNVEADVVADNYGSSADSAYESERASYTTSLASSITDYKEHMGRRFHAYQEGRYQYPNDEKEQDRLDLMHKVIEVSLKSLYTAPIKDPKRILDVGTGTGIWAIEMADRFPQADVLGNDLSPVQPRWVPPNVRFEVDDAEATWTFGEKFDLVHVRAMYGAIRDWPRLVRQAFEFTKPGAYAEFTDLDVALTSPDKSVAEGSPLHQFNSTAVRLSNEAGTDPNPGHQLEGWLRDAGFVDVKARLMPLPIGTWAKDKHLKEAGAWMYLQVIEGLESFITYAFSVHLGWSKEEVDVLCAKVRAQLKDPRVHSMLQLYNVVGRRPE